MKCHYHKEIEVTQMCKVCFLPLCEKCTDIETNCCWICSLELKNDVHHEKEEEKRQDQIREMKFVSTKRITLIMLRHFKKIYLFRNILIVLFVIMMFYWPFSRYYETRQMDIHLKNALMDFGKMNCNINIQTINIKYTRSWSAVYWEATTQPIIHYISGDIDQREQYGGGVISLGDLGICLKNSTPLYLSKNGQFISGSTLDKDFLKKLVHYNSNGIFDIFITAILIIFWSIGILILFKISSYIKERIQKADKIE